MHETPNDIKTRNKVKGQHMQNSGDVAQVHKHSNMYAEIQIDPSEP